MKRAIVGSLAYSVLVLVWMFSSTTVLADDVDSQIRSILQVEKEGAGHAAAVPALRELARQPATALLPLLSGMDHANPLATNWLRGAFESIADRSLKAGQPLPQKELEEFAVDRTHAPQTRSLAFDWLVKIDPSAVDRLVPGMLDDPSSNFRRRGVQRLIDAAGQADAAQNAAQSKELYQQAFRAALDPDQLDVLYDKLKALGETPDLKRQLGLINQWWLIAPFDHRQGIGFNAVYPPETEIDLQKTYRGKESEVSWVSKESDERHARLDLTKLIAPHKGAVAYAYHEFVADRAQPVEIRIGTPNGWKLWVNGELIFDHEEYHMTMQMDQYRPRAMLREGANQILLKICQNEQSQDWAQRWEFQVRVCDPTGTAVVSISNQALTNGEGIE